MIRLTPDATKKVELDAVLVLAESRRTFLELRLNLL